MNLEKLFMLQHTLDKRIETEHHLENENLINRKILALFVELGELANETRCFKFWSTKAPSKENIILEEYVDGIHFLLSLGLAFEFDKKISLPNGENTNSLVDQFLVVYKAITKFQQSPTYENFETMFHQYFHLGRILGFTYEKITAAYITKNEINHTRQDEGY